MALLELPALRSDDQLGFLAALGLVEVCRSGLHSPVRLAWAGLGGPAWLECDFLSVEELADTVSSLAQRWLGQGQLVPPPDPEFLPRPLPAAERKAVMRKLGQKLPLDPMRMERRQAVDRFARQRERELDGDQVGARWLTGLVAQLAVEAGEPRCELTPLYARTGQQNLHQLYAAKYLGFVAASPHRLVEALTRWRRDPADTGANLDHRDLRDAAFSPSGDSVNAGVPGANWLALLSAPFFRLSVDGTRAEAVGWQRTSRSGRPRQLIWPVWEPSLDATAIEVLLEHPLVRSAAVDPASADGGALAVLGVRAILRSTRRKLTQTDGPLQAPEVVWS